VQELVLVWEPQLELTLELELVQVSVSEQEQVLELMRKKLHRGKIESCIGRRFALPCGANLGPSVPQPLKLTAVLDSSAFGSFLVKRT